MAFNRSDPLAQQLEAMYLETWRALDDDLRERLRSGDDLYPEQMSRFLRAPHVFVVTAYWMSQDEPAQWNVSSGFASWAEHEAPRD